MPLDKVCPPPNVECYQCRRDFVPVLAYTVFALDALLELERVGTTCSPRCARTLQTIIDMDEDLYVDCRGVIYKVMDDSILVWERM